MWKSLILLLLAVSLTCAQEPAKDALPEPTRQDVKYGPDERNVLDFWQAPGEAPRPVLVLIHGGGWLHGDKMAEAKGGRHLLMAMLRNGVSVASINYRLATTAPLPAPVHDAARAIQYLRANAAEFGIDPAFIAATGGSAGGCTSLWLATHDDIADPNADDPVLRESSRICGAYVRSAQTTLEPHVIRESVTPAALRHGMIHRAGGFGSNQEMEANYEKVAELYRDFSPLAHLDANDPPTLLTYAGRLDDEKEGIHHARFGLVFKLRADEVRAPCYLALRHDGESFPGAPKPIDFLLHVLTGKDLP